MRGDAPEPQRTFVHPQPGEGWEELAARIAGIDVATLQSWNLHLAMRPPPIVLTPVDIVFIEPPAPASRSSPE